MKRTTALAVPVLTLFSSIFSHFLVIHPWSVHRSWKSQTITNTHQHLLFLGFRVV